VLWETKLLKTELLQIEKDLGDLLDDFLFELNTAATRESVTKAISEYLKDRVHDYAVRCDDTNNTDEVIAEHELAVEVMIQLTASDEFFPVPLKLGFDQVKHAYVDRRIARVGSSRSDD
jgi:hypothetical protein